MSSQLSRGMEDQAGLFIWDFLVGCFLRVAYRLRWAFRVSQLIVVMLPFSAWVWTESTSAQAVALPFPERIHQQQMTWTDAPSSIVRWALDAGAWGQAGVEVLGSASGDVSWRVMVALVLAPLGLYGFVVLSLTGLFLPLSATHARRPAHC